MLPRCLPLPEARSVALKGLGIWSCLITLLLWTVGSHGMSDGEIKELREETEHLFYHGYNNYMEHAFPEDELRPVSCKPLTRDRSNPARPELNDPLGNYSLTLIDSLSTLAILASSSEGNTKENEALRRFQDGIMALVEQYGDGSEGPKGQGRRAHGFDLDSKVQIFETVIRGVGGLLSAHLFAVGELPIKGYHPKDDIQGRGRGNSDRIEWSRNFSYDGQLLRLAHDLGKRLLPAFSTSTGLPYPRVNLRYGVPFYMNSPLNYDAEDGQCRTTQESSTEETENCSAGAGSLILELTVLSRLTGDPQFEALAKRAFWSVWERRSPLGLVGSGIDSETGLWTGPYTGLGAGIDSFFEYAVKSYVLLSGSSLPNATKNSNLFDFSGTEVPPALTDAQHDAESFLQVWHDAHAAIKRHLYRGDMYVHPHYIQADLFTGAARAYWVDSLSAFFPGLLTLTGNLEEAIETHLLFTALWTRYSALPERWSTSSGNVEGGLGWWGGRPEFIESTYHLYRATEDPWYLHVGEMALRDIKRRCWTKCGWSGLQDVRTGEMNDRMESFFLGETAKYLFLLFDPSHPLNKLDASFVFSTEGHPLIIPRSPSSPITNKKRSFPGARTNDQPKDTFKADVCPRSQAILPFSLSNTAARGDLYHAAHLARLHHMPTPRRADSPIVEFSGDHPSISISDVRSPSNFTYFPWTLPSYLVPYNATCSKMTARPTFDITFPAPANTILGPGFLQRVGNGILINSMGGLRLGMIQDVALPKAGSGDGDLYRVQAVNNVGLGKDEKIFLPKDVVASVVNPLDPNFTRIRDAEMLDIIVDVTDNQDSSSQEIEVNGTSVLKEGGRSDITIEAADGSSDAASHVKVAFNSLFQHVTSMLRDQPPLPDLQHLRHYIPAITPTGAGAAPIPDVQDALGPDITGAPQGNLLWHTVFVTDQNCDTKLPISIPKEYQIIVIKRGGCSFSRKLENIPSFPPTSNSLQLVIVVSFEEHENEDGLLQGFLIRPLLDPTQFTRSGLPRHHPIPMVMVGGGEQVYNVFRKATGIGIKRRYSVHAQGVLISNLIII